MSKVELETSQEGHCWLW